MFTVDIFFVIFMISTLWGRSYPFILTIAIILCLIQLLSYFLTATINPGLPKYEYQFKANSPGSKGNYRKCKECHLWIDCNAITYHCFDCNVCCEGYDHHCPWTTKCVGKGNIKLFYGFLVITFMTLGYFVFAVLMMGAYVNSHRK